MDEQTGNELQEDFAYIINAEKKLGVETGPGKMTFLFQHGGTVTRYFDSSVEATIPSDKKYLNLKSKYFGNVENKLSLFYPREFKNQLDKHSEI